MEGKGSGRHCVRDMEGQMCRRGKQGTVSSLRILGPVYCSHFMMALYQVMRLCILLCSLDHHLNHVI